MNSLNIFLFFVLFISNCIFAFIPHWTRKTENFGISIPEHLYDRKDFKKMRFTYTYILLSLHVVSTAILLVIFFKLTENVFFTSLIAVIFIFIFVSFILYLPFHFKMKRIKMNEKWKEEQTEVLIIDMKFSEEKTNYSQWWFIIPLIISLLTIIFTFSMYEQIPNNIPFHTSLSGEVTYKNKSVGALLFMPAIQLFMLGIFLFVNYIIKHSKRVVSVQNPEQSKRQNVIFRKRWSLFTVAMSVVMTLLLSFIQFTFIYPALIRIENFVLYSIIGLILVGAVGLSITTGQGGSRIKIKGAAQSSQIERDEDRYWKLGQFYFNKDDPSIFIEKRFGIGWTNNWAQPISWILLAVIIVIPFLILFILL